MCASATPIGTPRFAPWRKLASVARAKAYQQLGNGPRCGRCLSFAQGLIDTIHEDQPRGGQRADHEKQAAGEGASP